MRCVEMSVSGLVDSLSQHASTMKTLDLNNMSLTSDTVQGRTAWEEAILELAPISKPETINV